jgi:transcriptional regulator with XRE-family HTH domain
VADVAQSERINPDILKWARETAGLSVEEAAERLGLKDSARETAIDKLAALETGERSLSQTTPTSDAMSSSAHSPASGTGYG